MDKKMSQFQNPMVFPLALEFLSLKSLLHKDLRRAKHPAFKEAVPKTEVLEQPQITTNLTNTTNVCFDSFVFFVRVCSCGLWLHETVSE
jgi:hypothetical protein